MLSSKPLVVILGPTAVGKTEIAIQLAERCGGEIVSADSRLFYRGMDIGSAKPTLEERKRVQHHLIDVADPDKTWSLAIFQQAAHQVIDEIYQRGHLPFLVGGTGQYIQAVIQGWDLPPKLPDFVFRQALEEWVLEIGKQGLYDRLKVLDPEAANFIDPSNLRRVVRAMEVILQSGKRFSDQRRKIESPYSLLLIGLKRPRVELYQRVDERIAKMIEQGFADEVRVLLSKGYSIDLPMMSAIGYREMVAYIQGKMSLEEAVVQMKRLTRQFVRRQANWFKDSDPTINWFSMDGEVVSKIEALILARCYG
jgi:tRNA dimethylallyltransferase